MFWSIWKARNDNNYNEAEFNGKRVVELIKVRISLWVKSKHKNLGYSANDFIHHLNHIWVAESFFVVPTII
ncbi:unnamed protein product [Camellia sinensis]